MKKILLILALLPSVVFGAAFDMFISQRNIANTATLTRTMPLPELGVTSLLGINPYTNEPIMWKLGSSMSTLTGELQCGPNWVNVVDKPIFAAVATSGDYNDLLNKPVPSAQVNSDWDATSGVEQILNKPSLSAVATSGSYADLSGAPSIPAAQINSDWAAASGVGEILNKPTTLAGYGITDAYPLTGNPSSFLTGITSGQVIGALGFTPYSASNPSSFITQSGARSAISLTTTGTSGAATYNSATGVLNVPNYAPGTGTVTSVSAGSGLSGGTITTSGTISMPNTGTAGSYSGVTTDAQGRVTAGTVRSQSAATRALNTVFQVSSTRDAVVQYAVQCTVTASIGGGQDGDVFLDIASDSGFTANVQSVDVAPCSQTYTLAIALQGVQKGPANVRGYVPAGYYARIRTVNNTGTPAFAYRLGQEVLQ
ncbi:hypothetical protein SAMN03159476_00404 [Pseudomonas sp. NFPP05]|uniref:hypothetical protein n=1 Tax=unclassified Pseudomonas TaxID=196821 RepID=UPI00088D928A|nr:MULTISPECIES: hypothetical protein [unclassified Pseudomonas]SDA11224.1 hypothetical protein SAMN03159465_00404 [Pseudomonas sp. NFPP12]SFM12423.1 hypothetical protein SAMN03159476_00404 [Pseudomonas sp. NFPP05]